MGAKLGLVGAFFLAAAPSVHAAPGQLGASEDPSRIVGGEDALLCDWPAAVALRNGGDIFCTGSIVHPRVVLTAAHCLASKFPEEVTFGNSSIDPAASVGVEFCEMDPQWTGEDGNEGHDVALCVLSAEVDVPIVTPLMGCEADALLPDTPITIVGFGATYAELGQYGWENVEGTGTKRLTTQTLEGVFDETLYLLGSTGNSACPGDSGGPALVQLADGTWRVVGAGSRLHPDAPLNEPNACGFGALYSTFAHVMPWIEETAGYDVTPCHDADGTWNPDDRCTDFPLSPGTSDASSGTWADGCATQLVSGPSATCGEPIRSEPEPGGTGTSTGGSTGGTGMGSTGEAPMADTTGEASSTGADSVGETTLLSGGTAAGPSDPAGTDTEDTSVAEQTDASGCGCRTTRQGEIGGPLLLLGLLALRRRRKSLRGSEPNRRDPHRQKQGISY